MAIPPQAGSKPEAPIFRPGFAALLASRRTRLFGSFVAMTKERRKDQQLSTGLRYL
jgi:hypothetical protein